MLKLLPLWFLSPLMIGGGGGGGAGVGVAVENGRRRIREGGGYGVLIAAFFDWGETG